MKEAKNKKGVIKKIFFIVFFPFILIFRAFKAIKDIIVLAYYVKKNESNSDKKLPKQIQNKIHEMLGEKNKKKIKELEDENEKNQEIEKQINLFGEIPESDLVKRKEALLKIEKLSQEAKTIDKKQKEQLLLAIKQSLQEIQEKQNEKQAYHTLIKSTRKKLETDQLYPEVAVNAILKHITSQKQQKSNQHIVCFGVLAQETKIQKKESAEDQSKNSLLADKIKNLILNNIDSNKDLKTSALEEIRKIKESQLSGSSWQSTIALPILYKKNTDHQEKKATEESLCDFEDQNGYMGLILIKIKQNKRNKRLFKIKYSTIDPTNINQKKELDFVIVQKATEILLQLLLSDKEKDHNITLYIKKEPSIIHAKIPSSLSTEFTLDTLEEIYKTERIPTIIYNDNLKQIRDKHIEILKELEKEAEIEFKKATEQSYDDSQEYLQEDTNKQSTFVQDASIEKESTDKKHATTASM